MLVSPGSRDSRCLVPAVVARSMEWYPKVGGLQLQLVVANQLLTLYLGGLHSSNRLIRKQDTQWFYFHPALVIILLG